MTTVSSLRARTVRFGRSTKGNATTATSARRMTRRLIIPGRDASLVWVFLRAIRPMDRATFASLGQDHHISRIRAGKNLAARRLLDEPGIELEDLQVVLAGNQVVLREFAEINRLADPAT